MPVAGAEQVSSNNVGRPRRRSGRWLVRRSSFGGRRITPVGVRWGKGWSPLSSTFPFASQRGLRKGQSPTRTPAIEAAFPSKKTLTQHSRRQNVHRWRVWRHHSFYGPFVEVAIVSELPTLRSRRARLISACRRAPKQVPSRPDIRPLVHWLIKRPLQLSRCALLVLAMYQYPGVPRKVQYLILLFCTLYTVLYLKIRYTRV